MSDWLSVYFYILCFVYRGWCAQPLPPRHVKSTTAHTQFYSTFHENAAHKFMRLQYSARLYTGRITNSPPDVFIFHRRRVMQIARDDLSRSTKNPERVANWRNFSHARAWWALTESRALSAKIISELGRIAFESAKTHTALSCRDCWLESLINKWLEWSRVIHLAERCIMMQAAMQIKVKFSYSIECARWLLLFSFNYSCPSSTKHNKWNRKW